MWKPRVCPDFSQARTTNRAHGALEWPAVPGALEKPRATRGTGSKAPQDSGACGSQHVKQACRLLAASGAQGLPPGPDSKGPDDSRPGIRAHAESWGGSAPQTPGTLGRLLPGSATVAKLRPWWAQGSWDTGLYGARHPIGLLGRPGPLGSPGPAWGSPGSLLGFLWASPGAPLGPPGPPWGSPGHP